MYRTKLLVIPIFLIILLLSVQCSMNVSVGDSLNVAPVTTVDEVSTEWAAESVSEASGQSRGIINIESIERTVLMDNIAKYKFVLRLGNGPYDKIGITRVVKERRPWIVRRTLNSIMLLHGSGYTFDLSYLPSTVIDGLEEGHSLALYLASNDIDVWGLDFRTTFVPGDATDLSSMAQMNLSQDMADTDLALRIMRIARRMSACGNDKVILGGHNLGGIVTWALAGKETQQNKHFKDIKAMVSLDAMFKTNDDTLKLYAEHRYGLYQEITGSGIYFEKDAQMFHSAATLAKILPADQSPMVPGFTNEQAFIFFVAAMHATFIPPWEPYTPFFHYSAGIFNEYSIPVGFQFVETPFMTDLVIEMPQYVSNVDIMDSEAILSDVIESPYDDHLADIEIPILNISAAGGYGEYAQYTNSLTSSTDVTSIVIRLLPYGYEAVDFGSADILYAQNAEQLAWQPIASWIAVH